MAGPEIDPMTGYKTTGHEWDGIKELTTPIPGWWVTVFLATCFFSVVYMWLYPSIPTMDNVYEGRLGWSSERQLVNDMVAADVEQSHWRSLLASTPLDEVESNEQLRRFAVAGGKAAFNENCAPCHGVGGGGQIGQFPALVDDAWLWGGTVDDIYTTIKYGIRSGNDEARDSLMPTFGDMLSEQEITEVSQYVLALSDPSTDGTRSAMPGAELYEVNCASCHGANGGGGRDFGAPRLNDAIWLYGGTLADIERQVTNPKMGVMPAFGTKLDDDTVRMLAVYVHTLGGGES